MSIPAIEARAVGFAYGARAVLQDIDLRLQNGEIYGLVGADGAGKTTLLRLAAGQLTASSGSLHVLGQVPQSPAARAAIAYMPQHFGLYGDLSVLENLRFFADLHGLERAVAQARITELLARTGLRGFEARRASALSGGMRQKLALACALLSRPRLMLLDEPTTGVDPLSRRAFWRLLEAVRAEQVTILYATANMDEAERCDRVGLLQGGRLKAEGSPLALAAVDDAPLLSVWGPDARALRRAVRELPGVAFVFAIGARLHVWLAPGASATSFRRRLRALDPALEAQTIEPSLHDSALRALALARTGTGP